jgi:hypothetical protein
MAERELRLPGPLKVEQAKAGAAREWHSLLPAGLAEGPDYIILHEDFKGTLDAGLWTTVKDSGATVAATADADGGSVSLTSTATTDADGGSIQSIQEIWSMSSGKQLWMKCKVQFHDADDNDGWVGFSDAFATNPEAVLADDDMCGFLLVEGDATLQCKCEKNGAETKVSSQVDLVDATDVELALHYDGAGTVKFFMDGTKVATITTNIPDDEQLAFGFMSVSGSTSGTFVSKMDYVWICQER